MFKTFCTASIFFKKSVQAQYQRLIKITNFQNQCRNITKLAVLGPTVFAAGSDVTEEKLKVPDLRECIKHACLLNVNAASSLLTTTLFSIEILVLKYKETMNTLTGLLDECVLLDGWNDELWDSVIAYRSESNVQKLELDKLIAYLETVNKVVTASIEATFSIDANYLCTTLCEHSHAAEEKLKELENIIKHLDEEYLLALANVAKYQKPVTEK